MTADDKATIREVFLRWIEENTYATVTGEYNHPQPVGVVNDPVLLADPLFLRWAGNNYFTAHMRNIGLMALSFDAGSSSDKSVLIESDSATPFVGALVHGTVVLFPVDLGEDLGELTYTVPVDTARHLITGLAPGGKYDRESGIEGASLVVTIRPGTGLLADESGVLVLDLTSEA